MTVGTTIAGRYRVDQMLGAGGMGVVMSAIHLELGHRVAIKVVKDDLAANPTIVERFLREARAVVQLRTEHVCRVLDVGRLDTGAPYMVMELLDGTDLGQVVARQPLPVTVAVEYVMQACVAVAEAHAAGIVHRDIKPSNLFVTRRLDGGPLIKVLDFGIAKAAQADGAQLTRSHSMLGSPGYISPEQLQSARDVDVRTDIWALGVTLYQLLSARLPFYRPNATEMAVRIVSEPPDPLDVPPALRASVLRCLEKSPAQRYGDVAELAAELVPFGGPSGRMIAALVSQVIRRSVTPPAPLSPVPLSAATAASIAVGPTHAAPAAAPWQTPAPGASRARTPTPAPPVSVAAASMVRPPAPVAAAAMARPHPPADPPPVAGRALATEAPRLARRPAWWIAVPIVMLTAVATTAIHWCSRSEPPAAPVVAVQPAPQSSAPTEPATAAPNEPAPSEPAEPAPRWLSPDATAGSAAPRPRPRAPAAPAPAPAPARVATPAAAAEPTPAPAPVAEPKRAEPRRGRFRTLVGTVADRATDLGCSGVTKAEKGPAKTVVTCWCLKGDAARAQAVFTRLRGNEREEARKRCAEQGITLR